MILELISKAKIRNLKKYIHHYLKAKEGMGARISQLVFTAYSAHLFLLVYSYPRILFKIVICEFKFLWCNTDFLTSICRLTVLKFKIVFVDSYKAFNAESITILKLLKMSFFRRAPSVQSLYLKSKIKSFLTSICRLTVKKFK